MGAGQQDDGVGLPGQLGGCMKQRFMVGKGQVRGIKRSALRVFQRQQRGLGEPLGQLFLAQALALP